MAKTVVQRTRKEAYVHWIAALRSGKYRQAKSTLRETSKGHNSFCCLGVLCDLARKDGGPEWDKDFPTARTSCFKGEDKKLNGIIRKFMGMSNDHEDDLIDLNDRYLANFKTIADHIEKVIMPKVLVNNHA